MVRQFRIQGIDTGIEYSLNDFNKYLLTLPSGLGFQYKNSFITAGTKRVKTSQEYEFKEITATIEVSGNTRDDWEKNYNELRDFIVNNKKSGFRLYYKNRQTQKERFIICDIKTLTKTEKTSYGILVPIVLEPKSVWQNEESASSSATALDETGNLVVFAYDKSFSGETQYNYGYLYEEDVNDYVAKYILGQIGQATLVNNSNEETPLIITIKNPCQTPYMELVDINGNVLQASRIFVSLNNGDILTVNSEPENLSIIVTRANGTTENITTEVDTSLTSFLTLPVGSYVLKITDEVGSIINADIRFNNQFIGG